MTLAYIGGLLLGLGLITPIGPQNVFVFGQGITVGMPRALYAVVAAACCDSLLILLGAAGAAAILTGVPGLRAVMLAAGAVFLGVLGVRAVRTKVSSVEVTPEAAAAHLRGVVSRTVSVSLLNPHAILDTVGVIGAAIAGQQQATRTVFAAGTITASWLWFLLLAVGATLLRRFLTPQRRVWFDRVSGAVLLLFAVLLGIEFLNTLG